MAKISELEQRRQAGRSTAETGRRDGSHSSGSRPDWTTASPGSTEPELTE